MNQNQKKTVMIALIAFALIVYVLLCVCGLMIFRNVRNQNQIEITVTEPLNPEETSYTAVIEPTKEPDVETATGDGLSGVPETETSLTGTGAPEATEINPTALSADATADAALAADEEAETEREGDADDDAELEIFTSDDLSENQKTVIAAVERIRGLSSEMPLQIVYKSRDELRAETLKNFEENLTDEDFENDRDLLSLFGFIDEDFDIKDFYLTIQTEQIAGYYNSKENIMMLPIEADEAEILNTLSHEYTHFLQFSNFPELSKYYDSDFCKNNSEECLLGKAMIEGDAVLTEMMTSQEPEIAPLLRGGTMSQDDRVFRQAPEYFQESLLMEYTYGFNYMLFQYMKGGYDLVDESLLSPPASVEQLANPLLVGIDDPVDVPLGAVNDEFEAQGCELIQTNVLNIVDLRWMLTLGVEKEWRLDARSAERASDGWSGGAFTFGRCDGEPFIFAETQWDSRREAREFYSGLDTVFAARFGDEDGIGRWEDDDREIRIVESDSSVYFWMIPESVDEDALKERLEEPVQEPLEDEYIVEIDL